MHVALPPLIWQRTSSWTEAMQLSGFGPGLQGAVTFQLSESVPFQGLASSVLQRGPRSPSDWVKLLAKDLAATARAELDEGSEAESRLKTSPLPASMAEAEMASELPFWDTVKAT